MDGNVFAVGGKVLGLEFTFLQGLVAYVADQMIRGSFGGLHEFGRSEKATSRRFGVIRVRLLVEEREGGG